MRAVVLTLDYLFIIFLLWVWVSSYSEWDMLAVLGLWIFLIFIIPNLIYVHNVKPIDIEKEKLKQEINELKNK